jgi:hypothetical protein
MLFEQTKDYKLPLSEASWEAMGATSLTYVNQHIINPSDYEDTDIFKWSSETYLLAVESY